MKVKKLLNRVIQDTLAPIRENRKMWEQRKDEVFDILKQGSKIAQEAAAMTLHDVRSAMQINYFE